MKTNLTFLAMWNEFKRNRDVKNVKSEDKSGQSWWFSCHRPVLDPCRTVEGLLMRVLSTSSVSFVHLWYIHSSLRSEANWFESGREPDLFERKYGVWSGIRRAYKRYAMASYSCSELGFIYVCILRILFWNWFFKVILAFINSKSIKIC